MLRSACHGQPPAGGACASCVLLLFLGFAVACSPQTYKDSADREALGIIASKQQLVESRREAFAFVWRPLSVEDVGFPGEAANFRLTRPPEPIIRSLKIGPPRDDGPFDAEDEDGEAGDESRSEDDEAETESDVESTAATSKSPIYVTFDTAAVPPRESPVADAPTDAERPPEGERAGDEDRWRERAPDPKPPPPGAAEEPADSGSGAEGVGGPSGSEPAIRDTATVDSGAVDSAADVGQVSLVQETVVPAPRMPARVLDLDAALELAFRNNREYQSEKESVYLSALALSLVRWDFAPRFFGAVLGDAESVAGESSGSVTSDFGWNQLFASGARLSVSVVNNLFQFLTGDRRELADSLISASITQPVLRGFGKDIVTEPLKQAERDVVYALRDLERFRRTFVVQVVTEYYRVLEARNRIGNEYRNWQSLVNEVDRAVNLAQGQLMPPFQVDQFRQQELEAQNRFLVAVADYESQVDRFKVTLAIPVEASLVLDQSELPRLVERAEETGVPDAALAVATAMEKRLDLMSARDRVVDANRRARVAADALRAQLDVTLSAGVPSGETTGDAQTPLKFDTKDGTYGGGFALDLPFDRRAERNAYAAALVTSDRTVRAARLFEDNVRVTVRDAQRRLVRDRATVRIQETSVRLSAARVEITRVLLNAGRALARDVLESQEDLINAQNAYTSALIDFSIARLELHSDTGALKVENDGRFVEEPLRELDTNG